MPERSSYTVLMLNGRGVAGLVGPPDDMRAAATASAPTMERLMARS
ncbi:MAG TPA: hypothetical protein VFZ00_30655 [Solirubrobacter sp.]|jgi:hypothetical protein|nr:hypothetical protein [Solirubrobacter sp.]